jgi:hypothetical protein
MQQTEKSPIELDPMIGQEEQLDQVNAQPQRGANRKRPRCVTPNCPSKGKCQCPGFDGEDRDYSANLQGNSFCGYFKNKEGVWKSSK